MHSPAQSVLSLPFRHSSSAVWIIRAFTLIKSRDCPILLSSAASPGVFSPPEYARNILYALDLQFLGVYASLLPVVLCFLCLANCFICLEHNAPRGHVLLLYVSPSNTRCALFTYTLQFISRYFFRKISRPSPGPKSFDASEPSVTLIHSQNSPRRLRVHE